MGFIATAKQNLGKSGKPISNPHIDFANDKINILKNELSKLDKTQKYEKNYELYYNKLIFLFNEFINPVVSSFSTIVLTFDKLIFLEKPNPTQASFGASKTIHASVLPCGTPKCCLEKFLLG